MTLSTPTQSVDFKIKKPTTKWVVISLMIIGAYFWLGMLGLRFVTFDPNVAPVWLASGLALAALLRLGTSYWPAVFVGAVTLNLTTAAPAWAAIMMASGTTLEAVLGMYLLGRLSRFENAMERVADVVAFGALACLVSSAVAATIGCVALHLANILHHPDFIKTWLAWLAGDALGMLILTPFLLTWSVPSCFKWHKRLIAEFALLLVGTLMVCWATFTWPNEKTLTEYPFNFFPFVLWAALRFGPRGSSLIVTLIGIFAILSTGNSIAFLAGSTEAAMVLRDHSSVLQSFLMVLSSTGLLLAALTAERKRSDSVLLQSRERYQLLFEGNPQPMWLHDRETHAILAANESVVRLLGYEKDELIQKSIKDIIHEPGLDTPAFGNTFSSPVSGLKNLICKDNSHLQVDLTVKPINFDLHAADMVLVEDISERLKAADELRKSEQRLSLHIQQTAIGLIEWDRDFNVMEWNPAAENIFGIRKGEAMSKNGLDLIVPADTHGEVAVVWAKILKSKQTMRSVNDNITRSGRRIKCEWFNTPLIGADGEVIGVASLVQDITERALAQNALRDSEARFRSIVDASPMGIHLFELQPNGKLVLIGANPASESHFRTSTKSCIGKDISEAFPALANTNIPSMYRETATKGKPWWTDQVAYDGEKIVGAFEVNAFQSVPGKMVAMYLDVTERRRTEETLRLRDKAMDAITQGIIITDVRLDNSSPISYANPAFEKMMGYIFEEIEDRDWKLFVEEGNDPEAVGILDHGLKTLTSSSSEITCQRQDGTSFLTSISLSPIQDREGEVAHFVWVFTDVTALKRLETQFRQSQKMEAIGRLAGGVAHDFNNLLTAIIGYNDLMLADLDDIDPLADNAREIGKAAERAAALTGQLLAFSRQQSMIPQQLNLNNTIRGMLKMLTRLIGEDVRIETKLDENLAEVKAESSQLEQVIMNLAINSRDAMPEGGTLTIQTSEVTISKESSETEDGLAPGDYVQLSIKDTGMGMSESVREHLFEPFFTTKDKGKGTGLGLATCYGIINQSGGIIRVHSAPRRGSTFEIFLPVSTAGPSPLAQKPADQSMCGGTETLLVVEDDPAVRPLTINILQTLGYTVIEAINGIEAKKRIDEWSPKPIDLLVTDVVMPAMGGKELGDWMRRNHPETKILFTSGYLETALSREDLGPGDSNFLQKPFTPVSLAQKVRSVLDA